MRALQTSIKLRKHYRMECGICHNDISGSQMTMPCCQMNVHSACGIQLVAGQHAFGEIMCHCGVEIYSFNEAPAQPLPETPAFEAAFKRCNALRLVATKARGAFKKLIREKKAEFFEFANPHIQAIKDGKKAIEASIRSNDVTKAYNRAQTTYERSFNAILKDFSLDSYPLRKGLRMKLKEKYHLWHHRYTNLIHRPFRIRI